MAVYSEKKEKVCTIIMDRPESKNAIDRKTADDLVDAFRKFESDEDSHVAVLWGANGIFCAGADLRSIAVSKVNIPLNIEEGPMGPSRVLLKKPVIAAVSGYALAGGLELALWCDLRVIEKGTIFGVFSRRWGVPLIDGGTVRLPRLIGLSRALDIILTGRPVDAEEALSIGLANRLVNDGECRKEAEALAVEIARFPQICLRGDRLSAYEQFGFDLPDALKNELRHGLKAIKRGEAHEGSKRFVSGKGKHGSFKNIF